MLSRQYFRLFWGAVFCIGGDGDGDGDGGDTGGGRRGEGGRGVGGGVYSQVKLTNI